MANTNTRFVIVAPGKTAYTSPAAKEQFTSTPKPVIWNRYLEELLTVHKDIEVVDPRAYLAKPKPAPAAAGSQTTVMPMVDKQASSTAA